MNSQILHDELALPAYAGQSNAQVLELLNAQSIEYFIEPATPELTNLLMNSGLYAKLLGAYRNPAVPHQLQVAAESGLDLAQSQIPNVNLQNAAIQQFMNALVAGGIWTQADKDLVLAFARRTKSRAQELLGDGVVLTLQDIAAARLWPKYLQVRQMIVSLESASIDLQNGFDVVLPWGEDAGEDAVSDAR